MARLMGAGEVILELMARDGWTHRALGEKVGVSENAMWDRLHSKRKVRNGESLDMKVSTMAKMLEAMGYKMLVVSRDIDDTKVPDVGDWKVCELK